MLIVICNFTERVYENYRVGVPSFNSYAEILNSDGTQYGGSGQINEKKNQKRFMSHIIISRLILK
ncbi:hypothetical protein GCM10020331_029650 [Ectobacillus funiculus]